MGTDANIQLLVIGGGPGAYAIALAARFARHREVALADVAQTAVNQLRGTTRRARRKILALDQQRAQAPCGGVAQNPGSRDAPADHQQIDPGAGRCGEIAGAARERPGPSGSGGHVAGARAAGPINPADSRRFASSMIAASL